MVKYVLSDYVSQPLAQAAYDELGDGTFAGRIRACPGVGFRQEFKRHGVETPVYS